MFGIEFSPAVYTTIGIVFGTVVSTALGFLCVWFMTRAGGFGFFAGVDRRKVAAQGLADFSEKIRVLEHKQRVLSTYSGEYFNTLNEAGWDELAGLIDALNSIEAHLQVMFDQRKFNQVTVVCDFMLGRLSPEESGDVVESFGDIRLLSDWRERSRELLVGLIEATTHAAEQTKELGVERSKRKRKPTLVSLADLRGSLGDI